MTSHYNQRMQEIFSNYEREVGGDPADLREVGRWALDKGLWAPRPADIISQFSGDMADALREEYRTDSAGRRYRAKHAVRSTKDGRQSSLWADIDLAPRAHIERAFAQRRRQIVGDSLQLRLDVDHYNSARPGEPPIQLCLDFTDDVEEALALDGIGIREAA